MAWAFKNTEVVRIGDEEYTLAIDLEIIDALEDDLNLNFGEMLRLVGKGRVGKIARVLRGLLNRHHPDLSLDDVAELVTDHNHDFVNGMERLFAKASPEVKDENPPKARRGTGASSLSNGARKGSRRASSGSRPLELSS
jgi:hypothetical protein